MSTITADEIRETSDAIFNRGDTDYIDEAYAEDMVMHYVPTGEDYEGREAFKQWVQGVREAFPDFEVEEDDVVIGDEKVVTQWTARGTHEGAVPWLPVEPTNRAVEFRGVTVHKMEGGKATEAWWYSDHLSFLDQLGLVPEAPTA